MTWQNPILSIVPSDYWFLNNSLPGHSTVRNYIFCRIFALFISLFLLYHLRLTLSFPGTCRLRTTSGECCVPFTYHRRRYRGCKRHRSGRSWCYTTPDYRRKRLWGWCRGGKRRKLFIEDFVQRKADTKLCFPWRPLSHFTCCPTKALMVLKIDIPVCIRLLSIIFCRNVKCESTSRLGRKVKFSVRKKKFDFLPSRGQVVTTTSKWSSTVFRAMPNRKHK